MKLFILSMFAAVTIAACHRATENLANRNLPAPNIPASSESSATCQIIQHLSGQTQVCGQPQRIVVLGSSNLELLLALEAQPAGFADYNLWHRGNYDNPSQQIPYLGSRMTSQLVNLGLDSQPSIEAILNIQPDLILGTTNNTSQYKILSNIAPTLLVSRNDDDIKASLRTIAQALNRSEQAEQLISDTTRQVAAAREIFAPVIAAHPNVLLLGAIQWNELYLGDSNYGLCSALLEELGFQLVIPPGLDNTVPDAPVLISRETLPQLNHADSIIVFTGNLDEFNSNDRFADHQTNHIKQAWEQDAIAQSLNASKADRVYFIPGYLCRGLPGAIGTELYLDELKRQLLPTQ